MVRIIGGLAVSHTPTIGSEEVMWLVMRGQTLEEFQKTRNQQVLYSVAGKAKA